MPNDPTLTLANQAAEIDAFPPGTIRFCEKQPKPADNGDGTYTVTYNFEIAEPNQ